MSDTEQDKVNSDASWAPIINHSLEVGEDWHLGE